MADFIINGTTYNTAPTGAAARPVSADVEVRKIGPLLESMNGSLTLVYFGVKRKWTIKWAGAGTATRALLRAVHELTTTFSFTDALGVSYTCLTAESDYKETIAFTDRSNVYFYDLELVLRQV
jgi:hypothetical protein